MQTKTWHALTIFIAFTIVTNSVSLPCPRTLTTDITRGRKVRNNVIYHNGIYYPKEKYFSERVNGSVKISGCVCEFKNCYKKCCPFGEIFGRNGKCVKSEHEFQVPVFNLTEKIKVEEQHFNVIINRFCPSEAYVLNPKEYNEDSHFLQSDGRLYQNYSGVYHSPHLYCFEYFEKENTTLPLVCFGDVPEPEQDGLYSTGMIISLPFLLVTFLVYAFIPELRNLHGKCLMCYVLSLFIAYVFLITLQLDSNHNDEYCRNIPFVVYFAFMVSFLWLNVMCIDIWWTFSGRRGFVGSLRKSESKRFLIYSTYAWGIALVLVGITAGMQNSASVNSLYKPGFGDGKCWFSNNKVVFYYFYGPIMVILCINIILFAWTTYKIYSVKKETEKSMRHESQRHASDGNDKQRFKLYLKLILVFGVNWLMELISWAADGPKWVWYITDMCNAMYGVFIFVIFVCKVNVWRLIKKRYYGLMGRPYMASSYAQSSDQTRTTVGTAQDSIAMTTDLNH